MSAGDNAKDSAERVEARARALFGESPGPAHGVLHVVAVAREGDAHRVIRIGPRAPSSDTDRFVLELARARVDAILLSGAVLRAEPSLRYDSSPDLAAWRGDVVGSAEPPWLAVLTRGADLPARHPSWESEARPLVLTTRDAASELRQALPRRVEVIGLPAPSPRAALAHLRTERGCRSVSVEAGPGVALELYDSPMVIDELWLSVYEGALHPDARGAPFLSEAALLARMHRVSGPTTVDEPSGRWSFSRFVR